jgi:aerotaxis receptor
MSGYARDELIGHPHNVIRHPDMPRSAFYDLWETIAAGKPWNGMVKNRCKDGGYYWVDANVAPIVENGETVGYMSVRRKPTRKQVEHSERLYRGVREGNKLFPYTNIARYSLRFKLVGLYMIGVVALLSVAGLSLVNQDAVVLFSVSGVFALFYLLSGIALGEMLFRPIRNATEWGNQIATGNLSLPVRHDRNDEIGELFKSLLNMLINTAGLLAQIQEESDILARSSTDLTETSQRLSSGMEETSQQSQAIAAAVTQMNQSLQMLSSGIEEMSITISEVAKRATDASKSVNDANDKMVGADRLVKELGGNAKEIGVVIESIGNIASQTNLLALNAAIESAGAGEAGRGFAVVASEVKELARQTAGSSDDIKSKISAIQKYTETTVTSIDQITSTFQSIKELSSSIASAVEEQSITARDLSANVNQTTSASNEITQSINQISTAARDGALGAAETSRLSDSLGNMSQNLKQIIMRFRI